MQNNLPALPAELNLTGDQLSFSNNFKQTISQIGEAVNHAKNLVSVQTVDALNEDSLETTISDLQTAQRLARDIRSKRQALKKYLKGREDNILNQFDEVLNQAGFDELEGYNAKAKQLKKDLSSYRINKRWEELSSTFKANLDNYPLIHELAPKLEDFYLFKMRHPKLVNGSKSYKLGEKQMKAINADLYTINECLTDLKDNQIGLAPGYQNSILNAFIQKPEKDYYFQIKNDAFVQMQEAIKRQKEEQEQARKQAEFQQWQNSLSQNANELNGQLSQLNAQLQTAPENAKPELMQKINFIQGKLQQIYNQQQQALAQQKAEQQAKMQANQQQQNNQQNAYQWLSNYVMVNLHKYGNLKNNPQQKVALIYDLMQGAFNSAGQLHEYLYQTAGNDMNKQCQLILSMIGQILNV